MSGCGNTADDTFNDRRNRYLARFNSTVQLTDCLIENQITGGTANATAAACISTNQPRTSRENCVIRNNASPPALAVSILIRHQLRPSKQRSSAATNPIRSTAITPTTAATSSERTPARGWVIDDDLLDDPNADFDNIQAAVDAASDGDEIRIMPGTYTDTQDGHVVDMRGKPSGCMGSSGPGIHDHRRRAAAASHSSMDNALGPEMTGRRIHQRRNGSPNGQNGSGGINYWENDGGGIMIVSCIPTIEETASSPATRLRWPAFMSMESPRSSGCR